MNFISWSEEKLKRLSIWDIGLIKWSVIAFVLFVITIWPAFLSWVQSVNPWYFLIATLVFGERPMYRFYLK